MAIACSLSKNKNKVWHFLLGKQHPLSIGYHLPTHTTLHRLTMTTDQLLYLHVWAGVTSSVSQKGFFLANFRKVRRKLKYCTKCHNRHWLGNPVLNDTHITVWVYSSEMIYYINITYQCENRNTWSPALGIWTLLTLHWSQAVTIGNIWNIYESLCALISVCALQLFTQDAITIFIDLRQHNWLVSLNGIGKLRWGSSYQRKELPFQTFRNSEDIYDYIYIRSSPEADPLSTSLLQITPLSGHSSLNLVRKCWSSSEIKACLH